MTRLRALAGGVRTLRKAWAGPPEGWLLSPFLLPLPAAVFAWWALIVRPIWMPDLQVREAALTGYLYYGLVPVFGLLAHPRGPVAAANLLTLATLLVFGASTFTYPGPASLYLAMFGTATGVGAVVVAARTLLSALRDVPDRAIVNYFLVVLPTVLIVIVGQSVLWGSDRYNLIRLPAVAVCTLAVWGGIGRWARLPAPLVKFLAMPAAGLTLAVVAEALRLSGVREYNLAAKLLQGFGGQFVAYFGAGAGLSFLPSAVRRELSPLVKEAKHRDG